MQHLQLLDSKCIGGGPNYTSLCLPLLYTLVCKTRHPYNGTSFEYLDSLHSSIAKSTTSLINGRRLGGTELVSYPLRSYIDAWRSYVLVPAFGTSRDPTQPFGTSRDPTQPNPTQPSPPPQHTVGEWDHLDSAPTQAPSPPHPPTKHTPWRPKSGAIAPKTRPGFMQHSTWGIGDDLCEPSRCVWTGVDAVPGVQVCGGLWVIVKVFRFD